MSSTDLTILDDELVHLIVITTRTMIKLYKQKVINSVREYFCLDY